jgi:CHAT domain-containing protein/Tfp pilus assembly protein PilF
MKKAISLICIFAGLLIGGTRIPAASALAEPPGLIVEEIVADSPAEKAGLKVGDKLLTFAEKPLTSLAALQATQQNSVDKKEAVLRVRRGEETLTFNLPMGRLGMLVRPELPATVLPIYREAKAAQQAEKTAEAIRFWLMAAEQAKKDGDKVAASWLYWSAGLLHEGQENCGEALKAYDMAWGTMAGSQDTAAQVKVMESLGWCYQNLKNYVASQEWYDRALQLNTVAGYELWAAGDLTYLGRNTLSTGDFPAATGFFERAFKIYDRLTPGSEDVVDSLGRLGDAAYFSSRLQEAQGYYERALELGKSLKRDPNDIARNMDSLGSVVYLRGDLDAAAGYYSSALKIRQGLAPNGSLQTAGSQNNLGNVAYFRGDLLTAQNYYIAARDTLKREAPQSVEYASTLNNLGGVYYSANNLEAAQTNYSRALAIYRSLDPDSLNVATALNNLGNLAYLKNDIDAALENHRNALNIRLRLAPNSSDVADSLGNLATVAYVRKDLPGAEDYNRRALEIRKQLAPGSLKFAATLANLGSNVFKQGRFPEALQLFTEAVNVIEEQRSKISSIEGRAFFTARYTYAYIGLLETELALNDWPAAFAVVERARARSLIQLLSERRLDFRTEVRPELLKQQVELNQDRSTAYSSLAAVSLRQSAARFELREVASGGDAKRIGKLESQIEEFEKLRNELRVKLITISVRQRELETTLRRDSARFASLNYPQPLDLKGAQAALDPDTLLLSYFVAIEKTYLFAVTKNSVKVFTLPVGGNALKEEVRAFRTDVADQGSDQTTLPPQGKRLYDLLLGPAQDSIDQAGRVLICPDGVLNTLPFAALVHQTTPEVRYFIEDKPLHTINSMTVYAQMRKPATKVRPQPKKLLAFVNPINSLPALPSSLKEVGSLERLFGKSATVKTGREATETVAKKESQGYSILHFAVHGLLDDEVGLNSSLALSMPEMLGGKSTANDNGYWQAWEIFEQSRLEADLVVLSACDSGSGESVQGEGLIGLTRALQYAGARSIVVSNWEVEDESTSVLMATFYQGLKNDLDNDIALQKAMVAVRKQAKWRHPYYWSPFILVGNWE